MGATFELCKVHSKGWARWLSPHDSGGSGWVRSMPKRTFALIAVAFLVPIMVVVAMNKDAIVDDMTPRPENGYVVYVTTDR